MKVLIEKDYEAMSKAATKIFKEAIAKKPDLVLGFATGSTPLGLYQGLVEAHQKEGLDFSQATSFNLDEYVGIEKEHVCSYDYFMMDNLFNHINIQRENVFIPDGRAKDLDAACMSYNELIESKGGIDLQIVGIGENGHIAFNEPDEKLSLGTSIVALTEDTIQVNSRFFDSPDEVPRKAISMGMGNIMRAKEIVLLANGPKKTPIIKELLAAKFVSTKNPASLLLLHPNITLILTEDCIGESVEIG